MVVVRVSGIQCHDHRESQRGSGVSFYQHQINQMQPFQTMKGRKKAMGTYLCKKTGEGEMLEK